MAYKQFTEDEVKAYLKILKQMPIDIPDTLGEVFRRQIHERTGRYSAEWGKVRTGHVEVNNGEFLITCPDCGEPLSLHKEDGKCPEIIDAQFKDDDLPLLGSGGGTA